MADRRIFVWISTRFEAAHRWENAPNEYPFLRNYHRHEFHVRLSKEVMDSNREIEFINLKRLVTGWIDQYWRFRQLDLSCEQMALELMNQFAAATVEVSEDGENGATVVSFESPAFSPAL